MAKENTNTSGLAPILQKVESLTKPQRVGIYIGTLVLIIGLSIWLLFYPKKQTIDTLNVQLKKAQTELAKAKKNAEELNDWRTRMKRKQVQYEQVMQALPEKEEIPSLLAGISQAGKDAGLEFLLFEPKPESDKEFYAEIPVDIQVSGSFHDVAVFFDKVSNLPRIVNIRNVVMVPGKSKDASGEIATTCQAVTYKFIESKGQKEAGRKGRRKGRKK
ncbi:MAG: type 4a pilus biogenesis protein PilO [Desulfobacteraceae bacterium]|jgi:type IV pilus assembly protein PilO